MKTTKRSELHEDYTEMMKTESHHDHVIVNINGMDRWKENEIVDRITTEAISLNDLCPLLCELGFGKNSEVYRKLYRDMGYSLRGYYEIFYWDMNNDELDEYKQPT